MIRTTILKNGQNANGSNVRSKGAIQSGFEKEWEGSLPQIPTFPSASLEKITIGLKKNELTADAIVLPPSKSFPKDEATDDSKKPPRKMSTIPPSPLRMIKMAFKKEDSNKSSSKLAPQSSPEEESNELPNQTSPTNPLSPLQRMANALKRDSSISSIPSSTPLRNQNGEPRKILIIASSPFRMIRTALTKPEHELDSPVSKANTEEKNAEAPRKDLLTAIPPLRILRNVFKKQENTTGSLSTSDKTISDAQTEGAKAARTNSIVSSSPLRIPNRLDCDKETALVNGTLKITGRELDYYLSDGSHLFKARRVPMSRTYEIYDMTRKDGMREIASLSKVWTTSEGIAYRLSAGHENVDLACIVFRNFSFVTKLAENPVRELSLIVSVTRNSGLPKSSNIVLDSQKLSKEKTPLKELDRPLKMVQVFPSRNPYNDITGEDSLDFKGRGRIASVRNSQLVDARDRVVWQMAQTNRSEYNVDFMAPLNPLQAFATALASFDF